MIEARRITGPHLLIDVPGAAIELPSGDVVEVLRMIQKGADRLGWDVKIATRTHQAGVTVAMTAPVDQLYTAAALLEWAVDEDIRWRSVIRERDREQKPLLRALLAVNDAVFMDEDYGFTAGFGEHSRTWPFDDLPTAEQIADAQRIPVVFLTGTNGKTTTTRMLAKMVLGANLVPGWTSSDAYGVGDEVVESGDWTGPGAARNILRHTDVSFACLETARGGLLRRGLVIGGADAAVVTNVASDHLGEWGVFTIADMAVAKLGVAVGLKQGGTLVVNAGNGPLRDAVPGVLRRRPDLVVAWFSDGERSHLSLSAWADSTHLHFGAESIALSDVPMSFGGTARHNVENALAAGLAGLAAGLSIAAVRQGLCDMRPSVTESRGRMNRFSLPNGATVLVDFAHNPDGVRQVGRTSQAWSAKRRVWLVGQAGDRTDADLELLAQAVAAQQPDFVLLKHMSKYRRGRPVGEVVQRIREGLLASGVSPDCIADVASEGDGVAWMIANARPEDVMLMLIQEDLDDALARLAAAGAKGE